MISCGEAERIDSKSGSIRVPTDLYLPTASLIGDIKFVLSLSSAMP